MQVLPVILPAVIAETLPKKINCMKGIIRRAMLMKKQKTQSSSMRTSSSLLPSLTDFRRNAVQ